MFWLVNWNSQKQYCHIRKMKNFEESPMKKKPKGVIKNLTERMQFWLFLFHVDRAYRFGVLISGIGLVVAVIRFPAPLIPWGSLFWPLVGMVLTIFGIVRSLKASANYGPGDKKFLYVSSPSKSFPYHVPLSPMHRT